MNDPAHSNRRGEFGQLMCAVWCVFHPTNVSRRPSHHFAPRTPGDRLGQRSAMAEFPVL